MDRRIAIGVGVGIIRVIATADSGSAREIIDMNKRGRKPFSINQFEPTWEGRCWLDWGPVEVDTHRLQEAGGFKVLSYHVFADKKCINIRYSSSKIWSLRATVLLQEIKSYDADIVCLQDVDHFLDWWQPQLMFIGYDSLWKQRTCESFDHGEGVVIAYKRDIFQLFKTVNVEFNRAADHEDDLSIRRDCATDDVGIIAFLQPWIPNFLETAICVCSAMFYDGDYILGQLDVRCMQAVYLAKCIEFENRNLHLPVVIGVSLHDEPDSAAYHVLRTGRKQLMPAVPQKVHQPRIEAFSRASVKVFWKPAAVTEADPPVLQYVIAWRPGGSTDLGFCLTKKVDSGDCLQYVTSVNEAGIRSTIALEHRSALVSGLSAQTPFEFKVAAVNEVGMGPFSEASEPIVLMNPIKATPKEPLRKLRNITGVMEMREVTAMEKDDWDANKSYRIDINDPLTCLTPRTLDGLPDPQISCVRVLPLSTNPREGWRAKYAGEMSTTLRQEIESSKRVMKSRIMDSSGYHSSVSDTPTSRKAIYDLDAARRYKEGKLLVTNSAATQPLPEGGVVKEGDEGSMSDSKTCQRSVDAGSSIDKFSGSESVADEITVDNQKTENDGNDSQESSMCRIPQQDGADDDNDDDTFKYKYEELDYDDQHTVQTTDSDTYTGSVAITTDGAQVSQVTLAGTDFSSADNRLNDLMLNDGTLTTFKEDSSWEMHPSTAYGAKGSAVMGSQLGQMLNIGGVRARTMNDDVVLDLKEVVETIGRPNKRHIHALNLRSVYESYGIAGEPLYTTSVPERKNYTGVRCTDYIFFSGSSLRPSRVLSIPPLTKLCGDNPQESLIAADPYWLEPTPTMGDLFDKHIKKLPQLKTNKGKPSKGEIETMKKKLVDVLRADTPVESLWGGKWVPFACPSMTRTHSWLPNDSFASSHIALCAHFQINEDYKSTEWY